MLSSCRWTRRTTTVPRVIQRDDHIGGWAIVVDWNRLRDDATHLADMKLRRKAVGSNDAAVQSILEAEDNNFRTRYVVVRATWCWRTT